MFGFRRLLLGGSLAGFALFAGSCSSNITIAENRTAAPPPAAVATVEAMPTAWPIPTPAVFECQPTLPNATPTPAARTGAWPSGANHGNGAIWTNLPANGTEQVGPSQITRNGTLQAKWGWWRAVPGDLRIEGRRLNGTAADWFRADIPDGYGKTGFQVAGLTFSTQGCWEVTAHVGNESLSFVVAVVVAP